MRISTKLSLFMAGVVVAFCGLAATSFFELRHISQSYDALLHTSVRDMDRARVIQVDFKKEVQEWKDTLLRGHDPADLARYTRQFHDRSAAVVAGATSLAADVQDPQAKRLLEQFLAANQVMSAKYEAAYKVYVDGHADFKAADRMVRGQDRAPTDVFDQVVARLDERVNAQVSAQEAAAKSDTAWAIVVSGGLLLLVLLLGRVTVRSTLLRLAELKAGRTRPDPPPDRQVTAPSAALVQRLDERCVRPRVFLRALQ